MTETTTAQPKVKKRLPPHSVGPLNLLILQSTPFCNIDCAYCYLPGRTNKAKMPMETAERKITGLGWIQQPTRLRWRWRRPRGPSSARWNQVWSPRSSRSSGTRPSRS